MNYNAPVNSTSQTREDRAVAHSSVAAGDLETGLKVSIENMQNAIMETMHRR